MSGIYKARRDRLLLAAEGCDASVILTQPNLRYFSGFTGSNGAVVADGRGCVLITDFRYAEQAGQEAAELDIIAGGTDVAGAALEELRKRGARSVAFEDGSVSWAQAKKLSEFDLSPAGDKILALRSVKDEGELALIRGAAALADEGFSHLTEWIREGVTEKQTELELEFFMRRSGADGAAFPFIVASGARGAMPHSRPSDKPLLRGELVVCDFGARVSGYNSDISRTIAIGNIAKEHEKVYNICLEAQQKALSALRAGVKASEIDAVARDYIARNGCGECFGHGLGHGVGLDIHEYPRLAPKSDVVLQENMVVTVEPGIYLPGECGVRIEDLCVVKKNGCEVLFSAAKGLIIL